MFRRKKKLTLRQKLEANPGNFLVTLDGKALYAMFPDGQIRMFHGPNFMLMTDAEINDWIVRQLTPQ